VSRKASPTLIGAFVLAAVALLVTGVFVFGGRELFRDTQRFVTYFDGSVKGLRIGSNVLFRGVRVGYVTDIQVTTDQGMLNYEIPVTFEILPDALTVITDGRASPLSATASRIDEIIKAGLRTQLDVESFVTGQLVINLDMHPDTEAVFHDHGSALPEIPSIPSGIQQVLQRIQEFVANVQQNVPIDKVVETLLSTLGGLNELVNSPDLRESLAGVNRLINSRDAQTLPASLQAAIVDLQATTRDARALIGNVDRRLDPVLEQSLPLLAQLENTLKEGQAVLSLARGQLESNPETAAQLADALRELERSARSIRVLVDSLERKPEAILRGK
jgi:paraquat-inducible protein B